MHCRLGSMTLSQLSFQRGKGLDFPMKNIERSLAAHFACCTGPKGVGLGISIVIAGSKAKKKMSLRQEYKDTRGNYL